VDQVHIKKVDTDGFGEVFKVGTEMAEKKREKDEQFVERLKVECRYYKKKTKELERTLEALGKGEKRKNYQQQKEFQCMKQLVAKLQEENSRREFGVGKSETQY